MKRADGIDEKIAERQEEFSVGDAVLIEGSENDGKVGTVLKRVHEDYLIALEDRTQVLVSPRNLSFRR